jgi:thioester reductase-like protein
VVKSGKIIGSKESGGGSNCVANTDDYLWRVVAGAVSLGSYPVNEELDERIMIANMATVSSAILEKVFSASGRGGITDSYHDLILGVSASRLWDMVKERIPSSLSSTRTRTRTKLTPLSLDRWIEKFKKELESVKGGKHPLHSVQQFLAPLSTKPGGCEYGRR